jgi:hypothetical protein
MNQETASSWRSAEAYEIKREKTGISRLKRRAVSMLALRCAVRHKDGGAV